MKTATTNETLTPPPESKVSPIAADSGIPSRSAPSTIPGGSSSESPDPLAVDQPVAAEVDERSGAEAERGCDRRRRSPIASSVRSKATALISTPAPNAITKRDGAFGIERPGISARAPEHSARPPTSPRRRLEHRRSVTGPSVGEAIPGRPRGDLKKRSDDRREDRRRKLVAVPERGLRQGAGAGDGARGAHRDDDAASPYKQAPAAAPEGDQVARARARAPDQADRRRRPALGREGRRAGGRARRSRWRRGRCTWFAAPARPRRCSRTRRPSTSTSTRRSPPTPRSRRSRGASATPRRRSSRGRSAATRSGWRTSSRSRSRC